MPDSATQNWKHWFYVPTVMAVDLCNLYSGANEALVVINILKGAKMPLERENQTSFPKTF